MTRLLLISAGQSWGTFYSLMHLNMLSWWSFSAKTFYTFNTIRTQWRVVESWNWTVGSHLTANWFWLTTSVYFILNIVQLWFENRVKLKILRHWLLMTHWSSTCFNLLQNRAETQTVHILKSNIWPAHPASPTLDRICLETVRVFVFLLITGLFPAAALFIVYKGVAIITI